ncbi:E3 ISG15--protein ligase HERC5 isoform X1 [Ochotona princeps]|uniref:E3 ISG15--protein ligase HERC5 isoform X1 n=1 Tax=Ochotona princeps TaxID=9978 RepID=UPI0027155E55|nr:E3 ISG15--protein ligase HERC5 isoform X1 [Ochotona princeps]
MEPKPSRKSRGRGRSSPGPARPAESRFKESSGWPLWLFPGSVGLRSALLRRLETTRQVCCRLGRLAVLERGGTGVEVHPLPADSDGARKPKCIKLGRKMKIHSMDQGAEHLLILSSDGKPFEYNYSIEHARFQGILQEKIIIQITCGDYHSLALSKGGELFAWGQNLHGQLGIGEMCPSVPVPQIVEHLSGVPLLQISAGEAHSMALSMAGITYSWGKNDMGQLGLGHTQNEDSPCLIEALDNQKIEFVACGGSHTALLTQDGKLFTFGAGKCGQLGHNSKRNELKPRLVTELVGKRVTQIVCGRWHTLAYAAGLGKVFSFGSGKEGQLGSRGTQNQLIPRPMKLSPNGELKFESRTSEKELIMIAGGNQSILLWMDKKNSYVNLRRKIPTVNESTIKRWIADVGTKQWQNTKREIREIFTSSACLTGSFLRQRLAVEPTSVHLDLNIARSAFKELTQKDWITNTIITCLRDNLLKNLPVHSPHKEALEIFLILPECPVMHACNNWESLVIPFADAIYKLSDQSSMVLEEYWTTLPEAAFSRVVQMVRSAVASRLRYWTESTESNHQVKVLLEVLKKLHRVNQTTCQVPEEEFVVDELLDWLNFYGEAYRQHCRKADMEASAEEQNPVSFSNFSFLFNTLTKIKLLYADSLLKIQEKRIQACIRLAGFMEGEESELAFVPTFNLTVRRNHLIEDVLNQLTQFENEDLRRELWVSFTGEIGFGFRGVMTEFFYCLFEEMTQPDYGLFTYPEEASCMWFPVKPKFEEKRYYFFGMLCGLSLFNCNVANLPFPLALFKKLLGQNPSLEDLKELSPVLGKSLQFLLDNESSDFEEIFYIHFNIHWDSNDVDLIPNGSCIIVNQTNKSDYISKCVNYIFNISVKEVYNEFQRGFYKVCNKEIIQCFRPGELKDAIVGNTDFDWETFEKNARYEQGYSSSHPTIVMFWEALHKLSPEEKKKFLVFLTGTDRTQIKNLKNVQITFLCPEHLNEKDPMQAQTSFCFLYLPKYSTMERVEEALQFAISNNRGFG